MIHANNPTTSAPLFVQLRPGEHHCHEQSADVGFGGLLLLFAMLWQPHLTPTPLTSLQHSDQCCRGQTTNQTAKYMIKFGTDILLHHSAMEADTEC